MHAIDETAGKPAMAYVGEVPWHGLGSELETGASIDQWKKAAGLDWNVISSPVQFSADGGDQALGMYPGRQVLLRSDTRKPLSIVSDKYKPVHPYQVLEFFRSLVEGVGSFQMETAGALTDGRKIWALAKAKDEIRLGNEDVVGRYLLLATSYDLSIETLVQQTSIRVVCQNTLGMSLSNSKGRMTVNHRQLFEGDKVKQQMVLDDNWSAFSEKVNLLAGKKVDRDVAREYFLHVLFSDEVRSSPAFSAKAATKRVEEMLAVYDEAPGQKLASAEGTAWGLVNAVTYFVDHKAKSRKGQAGRLDKAWFGEGATMKGRAMTLASAMV